MQMIQDLYCRLYVNHADETLLLDLVTKITDGATQGRTVFNDSIDLIWSKNTDNLAEGQPEFLLYPSTFEVNPRSEFTGIDRDDEPQEFLKYLLRVIVGLRQFGYEVVASCEYEDLIAAETGWNWSKTTPDHPAWDLDQI